MSIWLTALKLVPWDDVIKQTPGMVRQARQLFRSSKKDAPAPAAGTDIAAEALDGRDPKAMAALLRALNQRVQALENERQEAAALMEQLAEQQEMVVKALSALRARAKLLTGACGILTVAMIGVLVWISRH